jgi:hypothetical protein
VSEPLRESSVDLLKPEFARKVKAVILDLQSHGLDPVVFESARSQERQDWLYAQGRTRPGSIVTWTHHSRHILGEAADVISQLRGWDCPHFYELLKSSALAHGLRDCENGTSWRREQCHIQLPEED